jgi:hypothetical protein
MNKCLRAFGFWLRGKCDHHWGDLRVQRERGLLPDGWIRHSSILSVHCLKCGKVMPEGVSFNSFITAPNIDLLKATKDELQKYMMWMRVYG